MLSSRQKLILKAIIDLYAEDAQPVGSKALTSLPYLTFSSATIRYDMAQLEALGFLEKTHTSSGRVPSAKGYRYYVDHLITRDNDVTQMFPLVDEIFSKNNFAKDRAVQEAIKLLCDLTNYTAVAIGPDMEQALIKKIDFIPLGETEAVVLIVTDRGHVQHQQIHVPDGMNINDLKEVVATLDDLLKNRNLKEASLLLKEEFAEKEINQFMRYQAQIVESFIEAFSKFAKDSFYLSGMTNVFEIPEFSNVNHIKRFMDMMDRREIVKMIGSQDGLSVKFSSDLEILPMDHMTIVSIPYRINDREKGTIAIMGPERMRYKKVIPLLEYIAANLGKLYKKEE